MFPQYFSWGNDKGSTTWRQINTEHFQVIYAEGFDSVAHLFANQLMYIYEQVSKSLDHQPRKISVLIHNQSTISNGMVAWAPRRMEIFDVGPQNNGPEDWLESLAIHEFRHVVQVDMLRRGFTNILYLILGEQALGAVLGIYVPLWFLEGDAVLVETAFTNGGRGRQASFSRGLRTQLTHDILYSYDKASFGSYKDYVPNHYEMGYYMVAGTRSLYSPDIWKHTMQHIAEKPYSITPFNRAIKRETGLSKIQLYERVFEQQQNLWKLAHSREGHRPFDTLVKPAQVYTNYSYPQRISNSHVVAKKSGFQDIPYFVLLDNQGNETKLTRVGRQPSREPFSVNHNSIVWAEEQPHIRWELTNTSTILMYSIETGKITKIKTGKRVYAPAISPNGAMIIAVEADQHNRYSLLCYDAQSHEELFSVPVPSNELPQTPRWSTDNAKIVFVTASSKGKRIVEYSIENQSFTEIHPYTFVDIADPLYWDEYVLFTSSYSGVENIYAIHTQTKEVKRITSSAFGSVQASVYNNSLLFADYSLQGFIIGQTNLFIPSWYDISVIKQEQYPLAQSISIQEHGPIDFTNMSMQEYESKPYNKLRHLVNIHSWFPFYMEANVDSVFSDNGFGFQTMSQNILGTMFATFGYKYMRDYEKSYGFANLKYTGFYPIITAEFAKGTQMFSRQQGVDPKQYIHALYTVHDVDAGIDIPFNFSARAYSRHFSIHATTKYSYYQLIDESPILPIFIHDVSFIEKFQIGALLYQFQFVNQRQRVARDVAPRWAQRVSGGYVHKAFGSDIQYSDQVFVQTSLFFPGLLPHHSFQMYGGYERNFNTSASHFNNQIRMPRGNFEIIPDRQHSYSLQSSYLFPVAYPDYSMGAFVYLKRIRMGVFADVTAFLQNSDFMLFTDQKFSDFHTDIITYGFELIGDMHLVRTVPEFSLGARVAMNHYSQTIAIEPIVSIGF